MDLDAFKAMMKKLKPETTAELAVEAFEVFRSSENTVRWFLSQTYTLHTQTHTPICTDELRRFCKRHEKRSETLGKRSL